MGGHLPTLSTQLRRPWEVMDIDMTARNSEMLFFLFRRKTNNLPEELLYVTVYQLKVQIGKIQFWNLQPFYRLCDKFESGIRLC